MPQSVDGPNPNPEPRAFVSRFVGRWRWIALGLLVTLLAALFWWGAGSRRGFGRFGPESGSRRDRAPGEPTSASAPGAKEPGRAASGWTLRVRVLADGRPVSDTAVSVFAPADPAAWFAVRASGRAPFASTRTDTAGIAVVQLSQAGIWHLVAQASGHARGVREVNLVPPAGDVDVTVHLLPGSALAGRVVDERGVPVPEAVVHAGAMALYGRSRHANARARTDAQGRFRFADLPAGRLQLSAGEPAGHPITIVVPFPGVCELVLRPRGALAGVVTDVDTGRPLSGVVLRIGGTGVIGHVDTDGDGRYELAGLLPGKVHRIAVLADGYVPLHPSGVPGPADGVVRDDPVGSHRGGRVTLALPILAGETTTYNIALRRGARLHGVVTGPDGPVAGARVTVTTGKEQNGYFVPAAVTDIDGRYQITGVLDGPVLVHADADGLVDPGRTAFWKRALRGDARGAGARVVMPRTGEVAKDIVLISGTAVEGRVETDTGIPLPGARVYAFQQGGLSRSFEVLADAGGAFLLEGLDPRSVAHLTGSAPGWRMAEPVVVRFSKNTSARGVVLRVARMPRVRGRVTDPAGKPVAGARIELMQRTGRNAPGPRVLRDSTPTGPDGHYERFLRSRAFPFQVRAIAPGYLPKTSPSVPVAASRFEYEADLVLETGSRLTGRVVSASGDPVTHAQIRVAAPGHRGYTWHLPVVAASAGDGSFFVANLNATRTRVLVSATGFRPVDVVVPVDRPAEIRLETARTIAGQVRFRSGASATGITIGAFAADGQRWDAYWIVRAGALRSDGIPGRVRAVTGADGRFELRDLAAGRHRLLVVPGGTASPVRTVRDHVVRAGATGVVVLVEPAPRDAFGTLSDEDLGRAARYMVLRKDWKRATAMWRALVARGTDAINRVAAMNELAGVLARLGAPAYAERETVAREAARLMPATTAAGLRARVHLAEVVRQRGRPEEALRTAREVADSSDVDPAAAARGAFTAAKSLADLGRKSEARAALERALKLARAAGDGVLIAEVAKALRSTK